jgi:hypothetical protein
LFIKSPVRCYFTCAGLKCQQSGGPPKRENSLRSVVTTKFPTPLSNRFIGRDNSSLGEKILHSQEAQAEAMISPDRICRNHAQRLLSLQDAVRNLFRVGRHSDIEQSPAVAIAILLQSGGQSPRPELLAIGARSVQVTMSLNRSS